MTQFVKIFHDMAPEVSIATVVGQLQKRNALSEAEKHAFKIAIIDIRDCASLGRSKYKNELDDRMAKMDKSNFRNAEE